MKRHAMSKYFGSGAGHVLRQHNSAVLLFSWRGKPDGSAATLAMAWNIPALPLCSAPWSPSTLRRSPDMQLPQLNVNGTARSHLMM